MVYFNYTYYDGRSWPTTAAIHGFVMTTLYGSAWSDGINVTTYGSAYGPGSLQRTVPNVSPNTSIWVRWHAQTSSASNPPCFDSEEKDGYIYLT